MSDEQAPTETTEESPAEGSLNAALAAVVAGLPAADAPPPAAPGDQPWTPERIASEREKLSGYGARVEKREAKFKTRLDQFRGDVARFDAEKGHVSAQLQRLRTGDAAAVMDALGALTGRAPGELYTEISLALARNGKPAPDAETKALRSEIEALKRAQADRDTASTHARESAQEAEVTATLLDMAGDATAYPLLSAEAAEDPKGLVHYASVTAAEHHAATGKVLALSEILSHMEKQIRARLERLQPGQSASQPEKAASPPEGKSAPAPTQEKPEAAQRSPGRTLSLGRAAQDSGRTRDLTQAERFALAAQQLPDWLTQPR